MCTPPPSQRHCTPLPRLIDDLIPEILLRIPPDDPACLARSSLACKPWRSVLTDPGFLRRYRAFHRTPPMLGFLRNTLSGGVPCTDTAQFVPTSSFRPATPDHRGMYAIAARHGRVLLQTGRDTCALSLVVWDPVTGEQWAVPPLPATPAPLSGRYNATVFCPAASCDHLDCHGGPFAVAFVGSCAGLNCAIGCVYSSEAGEWSEPVELAGAFLIGHRPGVLIGNSFYFTCGTMIWPCIVEYDIARRKLSVLEFPFWHMIQPNNHTDTLTVTEDGRLGFAGVCYFQLFLWSWEAGASGAMAWKLRRNINLYRMRSSGGGMDAAPGGDPQHKVPMRHDEPCVIGFADGAGVVFLRMGAGTVLSVELKSGRAQATSLPLFPGYDPVLIPYLSFYTLGTLY